MKIKSFIVMLIILILAHGTALADAPNLIFKNKNVYDDEYTYYLQRIYNGIPVYNEGVYITFDKDGNLIYLYDNLGEGEFEKAETTVSIQDAIENITGDILIPYYIKDGDIYKYVLKPVDFAVNAATMELIKQENADFEVEGNSTMEWRDKEGALKELGELLGQNGYNYSEKNYQEFNGSKNITYISGNKKFSYLNVAIYEEKPVSIMFSSMHSDEYSGIIDQKEAISIADRIFKKIVPEGNRALMSIYETEKDYQIDFIRIENGIRVEDNGLYVVISKDGYIKSLKYRWDNADFDKPLNINTEKILENYIEAAEIKLCYKKVRDKYTPVYAASKKIEYVTPQGSVYYHSL
ncbi:MAG: hypothetical protein QME46_09910 [Thermoanaerobacteraceae bacterium]|nr:hypothetical protein [Thermoanaerobacteraceae bacterium]